MNNNKKKQTVELTSVFHLSLTNRKTSYSSSSSFSESHGVLRTGIITMSFSTAITKVLPMRLRPACSDSATAPMIDKQRQRLTTIQVQPWVMEGRSIKWFKHFIETWLPRHFTLFSGLFSVQLNKPKLKFFAGLKWREHISYSHLLPVKFRNYIKKRRKIGKKKKGEKGEKEKSLENILRFCW